MNKTGVIYGINGPVIYLKGNTGFEMSEMVYVGKERLVGEVIALTQDTTTVQVFEETTGLKPGEIVEIAKHYIKVATGENYLKINEIQLAGKKRMPMDAFLNGYTIKENILGL